MQSIALHITDLLQLEPIFSLEQYEKFHAYWELLYRSLFANQQFTVLGYYNQ